MRNRMAHGYVETNYELVRETVSTEIPRSITEPSILLGKSVPDGGGETATWQHSTAGLGGPFRSHSSEADENVLNPDRQSRRIERQRTFMKDPDFDTALVAPMIMDDDPLLGIDDQIVPQARQQEVACELCAPVNPPARRGDDLDKDDRVIGLDRITGQLRSAADERIRLVDGSIVYPD